MGDALCTELTCPAHGELNRLRAALSECAQVRDELGKAYREAIGVPESEHTRERMERMAAAVESLTAERDALDARVDSLRDELGHAIRTRDEWESNAGDAEARVEEAEAEVQRVLADVEGLADKWYPGEPGPRRMTSWAQLARENCAREARALVARSRKDGAS